MRSSSLICKNFGPFFIYFLGHIQSREKNIKNCPNFMHFVFESKNFIQITRVRKITQFSLLLLKLKRLCLYCSDTYTLYIITYICRKNAGDIHYLLLQKGRKKKKTRKEILSNCFNTLFCRNTPVAVTMHVITIQK